MILKSWMADTKLFKKQNPELLFTTADKGKKSVIINKLTYKEKRLEHLTSGIESGTYSQITNTTISGLRETMETEYKQLRNMINPWILNDITERKPHACKQLEFEPFIISKLAISIKVHKEGKPPRPIISAPDRWAKTLSKWVLMMLTIIAKKFEGPKVKNSEEFTLKISDSGPLPPDHKLATFDYESMFTNVQLSYPLETIRMYYYMISQETTMPMNLFMESLIFLIESSSYFICETSIYKQEKGLTMGNDLSQMLADIATNRATTIVITSMNSREIFFVHKYVDDFIGAMTREGFIQFKKRMERMIDGLTLTQTDESIDLEVSYLDVLIKRNDDGTLTTKWWQKECSSRTILDYHSAHPNKMKRAIVKKYMLHALKITSPNAYKETLQNVNKVLRRSSYPKNLIKSIRIEVLDQIGAIHITSTIGQPDHNINFKDEIELSEMESHPPKKTKLTTTTGNVNNKPATYIPCPYYNDNLFSDAKNILKQFHPNDFKLAPSIQLTNGKEIFSTMKDRGPRECTKNAIIQISCTTCKEIFTISTGALDLERTMQRTYDYKNSIINKHIENHPTHKLAKRPDRITHYRDKETRDIVMNIGRKKDYQQ